MSLSEGRISSEGLERLRGLINKPLRLSFQFNKEVTIDGVRHLVWGIGDDNELWLDPDYAKQTSYGRSVAPPSYLYTIHHTLVQVGLPGVHGFHSGTKWSIHRPVFVGEDVLPICWVSDVVERPSKFGGRSVFIYFRTVFSDSESRLIATALSWTIRVERASSRERGKEAGVTMKHWTKEELEPVERALLEESPRGATPRYWEDTQIGEELTPILKGPLCMTDMVAWYIGSNQVYHPAFGPALKNYARHPQFSYRDPIIGVLQPNARVHDTIEVAHSAGVPAPYDIGVQRHQWLFHLLTNWVGDDGFIKECSAEFRRFNLFGDLQTLRGSVIDKRIDPDGDHVVDLSLRSENHRGEVTMPGSAVVALPTRESGDRPVVRHSMMALTLRDYLTALGPEVLENVGAAAKLD